MYDFLENIKTWCELFGLNGYWKNIELISGSDAEDHIKRDGASISDVFNVLNGLTYSRKIKTLENKIYFIG